jgi:predicted nucleic acid-binding Zn ribbon protein
MRFNLVMATYIYETTETTRPVRRFEIQQSMKDDPLTADPETGEPIRRVITGGFGFMSRGDGASEAPSGGGHSCGSGCGCGL